MVEAYLKLLEQGYFEVTFAFNGLADENVWKRPAPGLLSIGELAGHLAYWEAARLAPEVEAPAKGQDGSVDADPSPIDEHRFREKSKVRSPLIDQRFAYYTTNVATQPSAEHLAMTAQQVSQELIRVHQEAVAHFRALAPDLTSSAPGWPANFSYGASLEYLVFHIAYHTGQMYSVRHLLGDVTADN